MTESWGALLAALTVLAILIACRAPVALALFGAGGVGLLLTTPLSALAGAMSRTPYDTTASYALVIIPLFIAMGVFARHGSLATNTFYFARRWLGNVPGGLPIATVLACGLFAAVSGSSVATVAALGPLTVKEMTTAGYSKTFSAGVVGASGTLGILIPPSIVLVMFGIVANVSIGDLFLAGIIPGALTIVVYSVAILMISGRLRETIDEADRPRQHDKVLAHASVGSIGHADSNRSKPIGSSTAEADRETPHKTITFAHYSALAKIVSLFLVVIGGLYTGLFTINESAAAGAGLALVFFILDLRSKHSARWRTIKDAFVETVNTNAMIFFLLIGAGLFSYFLVSSGIPAQLTTLATSAGIGTSALVVAALVLCIILGMFLDSLSIILIITPLVLPLLMAGDVDLVWFGILLVKAIEIGLITPPLGLNAFVLAGAIPGLSVQQAFKGVLYFLPLELATIVILFLVPELVTFLPGGMN